MMIESIKRIALETIEASQPVQIIFGTVNSVSPLIILVDNRIELTSEFFVMTETIQQKGLFVGNNLVLIRYQGGQQFLIIDKVV